METGKLILLCKVWIAAAIILIICVVQLEADRLVRFVREHEQELEKEIKALTIPEFMDEDRPSDLYPHGVRDLPDFEKAQRIAEAYDPRSYAELEYPERWYQYRRAEQFGIAIDLIKLFVKLNATRNDFNFMAPEYREDRLKKVSDAADRAIHEIIEDMSPDLFEKRRAILLKIAERAEVHLQPYLSSAAMCYVFMSLIASLVLSCSALAMNTCYGYREKTA